MNTSKKTIAKSRKRKEKIESPYHQRYATFALELLLNDDNMVRRTKVTHVQSGESQTWAKWVASDVTAFIESKERLHPNALVALEQNEKSQQKSDGPEVTTVSPPQTFLNKNMSHLSLLGVLRTGNSEYNNQLPSEQPYTFQLALDVSEEGLSRSTLLTYEVFVRAKQLGSGNKAKVGAASGTMCAGKHKVIDVIGEQLTPGIYRLDVGVTLLSTNTHGKASELSLWQEGGLLSIY